MTQALTTKNTNLNHKEHKECTKFTKKITGSSQLADGIHPDRVSLLMAFNRCYPLASEFDPPFYSENLCDLCEPFVSFVFKRNPRFEGIRSLEVEFENKFDLIQGGAKMAEKTYSPYHQMKDLCGWVKDGTITKEEFKNHLDILADDIQEWFDKLRGIEVPEETFETDSIPFQKSWEGIDLFNMGLQEIYQYAEDGKEEHFEKGLELAAEGFELVKGAMTETEENIERILEEQEEMQEGV